MGFSNVQKGLLATKINLYFFIYYSTGNSKKKRGLSGRTAGLRGTETILTEGWLCPKVNRTSECDEPYEEFADLSRSLEGRLRKAP